MRLVPVDYKWIYDQCLFDYAKQLEMHVFVGFVDSSFLEKETKKNTSVITLGRPCQIKVLLLRLFA